MKMFKSILITLICACAVLAIGYAGIIFCGGQILKISSEPEQVTTTGNLSSLFYSRMEDDIQLFPWNFYPGEESKKQYGDNMDAGSDRQDLEANVGPFSEYSFYLENNVFYTLISLAADVEHQEVSRWYNEQNRTIMGSMVEGKQDGMSAGVYFYDDTIRLNGKVYRVKIACAAGYMLSFSCIRQQEGVKETEEWREQKEILTKQMQENPEWISLSCAYLYEASMYYMKNWEEWYLYVDLYRNYLDAEEMEISEHVAALIDKGDVFGIYATDNQFEDMSVQIIELQDSLLLVVEKDITMGIYYDVLQQRVTGFHFFL